MTFLKLAQIVMFAGVVSVVVIFSLQRAPKEGAEDDE